MSVGLPCMICANSYVKIQRYDIKPLMADNSIKSITITCDCPNSKPIEITDPKQIEEMKKLLETYTPAEKPEISEARLITADEACLILEQKAWEDEQGLRGDEDWISAVRTAINMYKGSKTILEREGKPESDGVHGVGQALVAMAAQLMETDKYILDRALKRN